MKTFKTMEEVAIFLMQGGSAKYKGSSPYKYINNNFIKSFNGVNEYSMPFNELIKETSAKDWKEYIEPKWYETHLPSKKGILCNVYGYETPLTILAKDKDDDYLQCSLGDKHHTHNVTPMTRKEVLAMTLEEIEKDES